MIEPSVKPEASMPENVRVPPPATPAAVAPTVVEPSVKERVTVSLVSDVEGSTMSNVRLAWLVALM